MNEKEVTLMDILSQKISNMERDLTEMKTKMGEVYYSLIGNPMSKDGGIIRRIERVEEDRKEDRKRITELEGKTDKLGWYQRVLWLAVGFAASSIFVLILQTAFKK